jgi:hypothetical protein
VKPLFSTFLSASFFVPMEKITFDDLNVILAF